MDFSQPTASKIRAAKRRAVGGGRKRCKKGKNCSAACIQSGMYCLVEMPEPAGASLGKLSKFLVSRGRSVPSDMKRELAALGAPRTPQAMGGGDVLDIKAKTVDKSVAPLTASGGTRYARGDAQDFDKDLSSGKLQRVGDKSYLGWTDSYGSGAKAVGEGSYGTVIKNKDGTYVKRGAISETEADLIKKLGEKDIGPRLIAADVNGKHSWHNENFVDIRNGRIAMTGVPGAPMGEVAATDKIAGKNAADIYWKAMADLHRLGIAHNDAHIENILIDDKGKGRWVDLGLAQDSPRAALAEALGSFKHLKGGDDILVPGSAKGNGNWQSRGWDATGYKLADSAKERGGKTWEEFEQRLPVVARVWKNQDAVIKKLQENEFDINEINSMIEHGIRSPLSSYNASDGFSKITDKQAQELLNILYDGI